MKIFSSLMDRVLGWSEHPKAPWYLGALSFAESSFFPIPPDIMLAPMVMARREKRLLSVVILRVDGFKAYREVFGRHAADSCLGKVAHAITGSLRRAGDLAARYSDDQFIVLVGNSDKKAANQPTKPSNVTNSSFRYPTFSLKFSTCNSPCT